MIADPRDYLIRPQHAPHLKRRPTRTEPLYADARHYDAVMAQQQTQLDKLQKLLFAGRRNALLVIFQGMDAAGKDSAIGHIFAAVNPEGCEVYSFQQPSAEEKRHDFLWRAVCRLPERGRIGIFNRSYYEDVLVVRVHPQLLGDDSAAVRAKGDKALWKGRYRSIVDLERHLCRNGTVVVKIFLHLSPDEQRARLLQRIDDPDKNWKFSAADIEERRYWRRYMRVYADCLAATSTDFAPWYVVPADDKKNAHLIVAEVLIRTLEGLGMRYPRSGRARLAELAGFRRDLEK